MELIFLDELERSLVYVGAVIGAVILMPLLLDRSRALHRTLVMIVAAALAIRYLWWRATETLAPFGLTWDCIVSWGFYAVELAAMASSLSVYLLLCRSRQRHGEADRHANWWEPGPPPRVVVLVATYNEDAEVLERTLSGAAALDHPNLEVWVLDDGRRDWLRDLAHRFGARHVTREGNAHAKAGNINNALALMAESGEPPDFVAVLDADFVPHRNFVSRALALFHDPRTALVQTPQHFFNPDPIQQNLGLRRSYPDEQRFFFHELLPARDAWDIAFCCGTSSIIRYEPLERIGFFPTSSVTEDFLLSLVLKQEGYSTVFLDEPLTQGLAPEGVREYMTQRARWCLGQMQITRGAYGPFSRARLGWRQRWSVVDAALHWIFAYTYRIAALVVPLFYWYFNILVLDATVPEVIEYFGVFFLFSILSLSFISNGLVFPILHDVGQVLGTFPIARAAYTGLFLPHGHAFKVTAKGGDRSRTVVQWGLMRPFLVLFVLTAVGLVLGLVSWRFEFSDAGDGKVVTLFWTLYNLFVLGLTILACIELPRMDRRFADVPERVVLEVDGGEAIPVWMRGLTLSGARLRGIELPVGQGVAMTLRGRLRLAARVIRCEPGNVIVRLELGEEERITLLRWLHTEGGAPNVTRPSRFGVLGDLLIRLATGRA